MQIYQIASVKPWYHGSRKNFNQFNNYSWFSIDKNMASNYVSWATEGIPVNMLYIANINTSKPLDLTAYDMDDRLDIIDVRNLVGDAGLPFKDSEIEQSLLKHEDDTVSVSWIIKQILKDIAGYDSLNIMESGVLTCCVFRGQDVTILKKIVIKAL